MGWGGIQTRASFVSIPLKNKYETNRAKFDKCWWLVYTSVLHFILFHRIGIHFIFKVEIEKHEVQGGKTKCNSRKLPENLGVLASLFSFLFPMI